MERFAPYLGVVAALAVGIVAANFVQVTVVAPSHSPSASSTVAVLPGVTVPSLVLPAVSLPPIGATTTALPAPSPVTKTPVAPAKPVPAAPAHTSPPAQTAPSVQVPPPAPASATPATSPAQPSSGNAALDAAASSLRAALVNIICYVPAGSHIHSISGSGVIISPDGYILTNAHVAQYFLLADQGVDCTIRTGSPAADAYTADLAFISPAWLQANASLITQQSPSGTGEHDFALLAISGSAADAAVPSPLPFIPVSAYPPSAGTPVVIGSYGAQFLDTTQIQSSLSPTLVFGSVKDVYTFGTNTIDVLSLGGSAAAQEGSSGGGVAGANGALLGTITTSTVSGSTATRSLDAITTSYIRADYATETGKPLEFLLSEATSTAVADFSSEAQTLEAKLLAAIGS